MVKVLGWIGTGVMGKSMCSHLLKAGNSVYVYNRNPAKTKQLADLGGKVAKNFVEIAENADIIFSMVGFPKDVEEVYLAKDGIIAHAKKGAIIVDMTTSEPTLARKIADEAIKNGVFSLDAPVSGGDIGARNATLAIMVGGDKKVYEEILPLFKLMGQNIALMGPAGAGQHTKMCNQIHIASTMIGMVECLLYAQKAELNLDQVIDVIGQGAAASWSLNNLGRRIVKNNFDPGFFIKHFVKDMGIALDEAKKMNLSLPGLALANQFYIAAVAEGLENLGTHGIYKVLAKMNGMSV